MSRRSLALLGLALPSMQAQTLASAYALYLIAQGLRNSCVARGPATAARSRQAFWTPAQGLDRFEAQLGQLLGAKLQGQLRTQLQGQADGLTAGLQKLGSPAQVCGL